MKTLAVIPAKGHSNRIPDKNLKLLEGKTLLEHTITHALGSKHIDKIVVSTEDNTIKEIARMYPIDIVDRPPHLATDTASTESVIQDVLDKTEEEYDTIILLQCTSPLRKSSDIDEIMDMYNTDGFDSIVSVCNDTSIIWKKKYRYGIPVSFSLTDRPKRSQDIDLYRENGAIYIFSYPGFLKHRSRVFGRIGLYIMPVERSADIDNMEDLEYVRWKYGKI